MIIKRARVIFITFVIVVLTLTLSWEVIKDIKGEPRYASSANIEQLTLCDISYSSSGVPKSVKVCGNVSIDVHKIAPLTILLFKMPEKDFVSSNPADDIFYAGPFSRELKLGDTDYLGSYKVEIYLYRGIVASTEFKIKK